MVVILKTVLGVLTALFGSYYLVDVVRRRDTFSTAPWAGLGATGFFTNLLDTLGIGSFAQQTAIFKFFRLVDDRIIPGTMNVGNTLPTVTQAFLFMAVVSVEPLTLAAMSTASPLGAVLGAGVVARMSRRRIQLGMGFGLLVVALVILAGLLGWFPVGGEAIGLSGWKLAVAVTMSFIFGALQTIGVGFYAPCMATVYALGMHPKTAFPIMMTATAMLMAAGSARFVKEKAYDRKAALALTVCGILGVLVAAYIVKALPLTVMKWVVLGVVLYTSAWMFISAASGRSVPGPSAPGTSAP
ncbi:MAG: sulfite exporter TauE/SafE family protein [Candidatus Aminicenantes bacterium]|nr:sulfite exporter TauE/SafE family protein [Candidatus Aminicenantes bacterium]